METTNWPCNTLSSKSYTCGYCGESLASEKGFVAPVGSYGRSVGYSYIYICHHCGSPTYFNRFGHQTPGHAYGAPVQHINDNKIEHLYNEARRCVSTNSYIAAVMCCRKILLHLAISKGAKLGSSFIECVDYISNKGFVPPDGKEWVEHIRNKGNEANHEIVLMSCEDAQDLIDFIEMLLKFIYQFPSIMKMKKEAKDANKASK